jgi:hypothetical protein
MTAALDALVARALATPVPPVARALVATLARTPGAVAVLFYGSNLRTGAAEGVLDFYVLTDGPRERGLWPRVGYREEDGVRAKVATMRLATFAHAAAGRSVDTTIWARFVQPAVLAWATADARGQVEAAVAQAARTAARFAAALGPAQGRAADYWQALFRATYTAEWRVEKPGREASIISHDPARWDALLPAAWTEDGIAFASDGDVLRPRLDRGPLLRAWAWRRRWGKPLNIARLVRAAWTFDGAAAYAAWKIERHTGVPVPLSAWAHRHPVLAAPGVLWRVWRARS